MTPDLEPPFFKASHIPKTMKTTLLLCLLLAWSGDLFAQADETVPNAPKKFIVVSPWKDKSITLVVSGSTNFPPTKSKTEMVPAKSAIYAATNLTWTDRLTEKMTPLEFDILAITNPLTGKICFIRGGCSHYLADNSRIVGLFSIRGRFCKSYIELLAQDGGMDAAIGEFERRFNDLISNQWRKPSKERQWEMASNEIQVPIMVAAPVNFFIGGPNSGIFVVPSKLEAIDLSDGILRLQIYSPYARQHGIFYLNLNTKKVVKSVVGGQEMNLNSGQPFAVPLKGKADEP